MQVEGCWEFGFLIFLFTAEGAEGREEEKREKYGTKY
jgi:hypothetical protein